MPKPLKLEAITIACSDYSDPSGLKWRIMFFEGNIYSRRVKKFNADAAMRNKRQ